MPREIKFRAWDKDLKGWIVEQIFFSDGVAWIKRGNMLVKLDADVMQYTGLHDKNGKEIYEGDIVKWISGSPQTALRNRTVKDVIVFQDGYFGGEKYKGGIGSMKPIEVIGNIYENPELSKYCN